MSPDWAAAWWLAGFPGLTLLILAVIGDVVMRRRNRVCSTLGCFNRATARVVQRHTNATVWTCAACKQSGEARGWLAPAGRKAA